MKKLLILLLCLFVGDSFATGISGGTTAPCDNDTLNKYTGTANVEINWEPNTIGLNWYDGDTKLTVENNSQSCVYDGTITVPPQPTKLGYTFNGWKVIRVPGGFTELEYLESTGTQYIDMNITVKANTLAEFEYQYTATDVPNFVFGQIAGYGHSVMGYRSWQMWWFVRADGLSLIDSSKHKVEFKSDGHVYLDGNVVAHRGEFAGIQNLTILLFAERNDEGAIHKGKVKIFNFTLKEGDIVVRNFIPAKRNSDGVLGMWDTITQTFFTNDGTGTFVGGPAVQ